MGNHLDNPDLGALEEYVSLEGAPIDSAEVLFNAFLRSAEVPMDPDFAVSTVEASYAFYSEYITNGGFDTRDPERMEGRSPTMNARMALWGRFKLAQIEIPVKPKKRETSEERQNREYQIYELKKQRAQQIKRWEQTCAALSFKYRHASIRPETEVDTGKALDYDEFEKTILELNTIFARMYLELVSGLDLNPYVRFETLQSEYTQAYQSGGYIYVPREEMPRNSARISLVKKRYGTRFGELINRDRGVSTNTQGTRKRGRRL